MLRSYKFIVAALFALVVPLTVHADRPTPGAKAKHAGSAKHGAKHGDEVQIIGGGFAFLHAPVNLVAADFCIDPPGFALSVTSESLDGHLVTTNSNLSFTGSGEASGCVFLPPIDDVAAEFAGSFTWRTADGELRGTFELLDFASDIDGVFAAFISITFDGGTGRFKNAKGEAFAEGLDFPFGGPGGAAGVVATFTEGELKLRK